MSKLRSLNTIIWSDPWFETLEPSAKLLFIYLVTNEKTNMLGVYEISIRKVSFETCISEDLIKKYLIEFENNNKIKYSENRVLLLNFLKHQNYNFNMMKSAIRTYNSLPKSLKVNDLKEVKETKEGFKTLCNGFSGVRKIEYEVEDENEIENEVKEEGTFHNIEKLVDFYLKDERLCKAIISNKDNGIKDKNHLYKLLTEFSNGLKEQGRFSETWKEFTRYFRNWAKSKKHTLSNKGKSPTSNMTF